MTTFTPILGIAEVAPTQVAKEVTINDGFVALENATNAIKQVTIAAADITLLAADYTGNFLFQLIGTPAGSQNFIVPNTPRFFAVWNQTGHAQTVKTAGSGTTVSVANSALCVLVCDAANNIKIVANSAAAAPATSFTGLSDVPGSYSGDALYTVRVNAAATALEFHLMALADIAGFGTPTTNYYPQWNGSGFTWTVGGGGPGVSDFIGLSDVPGSYSGKADYVVQVNAAANALQFTALNALLSFLQLTDVPAAYSGSSNKVLACNLTENGLTFIPLPSLGTVISLTTGDPNAGFEGGGLGSWAVTIGSVGYQTVTNLAGSLAPYSGSFFELSAGATTQTQITRTWNLTTLATPFQLDNDCRIDVPYAFAMHGGGTTGQISVDCLDGVGALISTYTGPTITSGTDLWVDGTFSVDNPPNTRSIKIHVTSNSASAVSAGWDLLDPVIRAIKNPSLITMSDGPTTYAGAAKYIVRVNAAANGFEFHQEVFTDLADVPNAYTGQALKVLRVNNAENAVEFWQINRVDMPCPSVITATGSVALDRANGEVQRLSVTGNVTAMTVANWAPSGTLGKLSLEVVNTGSFTVVWPTGTKWPGGSAPTVTHSGRDIFVLMSFDGGTTIYGNVVGQAYA